MEYSIKDFFTKWDQIRSSPWIWSHLLMKSLMKSFIFRAVLGKDSWDADLIVKSMKLVTMKKKKKLKKKMEYLT